MASSSNARPQTTHQVALSSSNPRPSRFILSSFLCLNFVRPRRRRCSFRHQGRDLSVFCRLWLVNRTEMVLQHRDSSLAGGIDSTFIGDRMPQVTQPGRREAASPAAAAAAAAAVAGDGGEGEDDRRLRLSSASDGARTPTKVRRCTDQPAAADFVDFCLA